MKIKNKEAFRKWAERDKGRYWFRDNSIIKTYGLDQLKDLYPDVFEDVEVKDVGNIYNVSYSFKLNDVNINESRLEKETDSIYKNPAHRGNRTYDQVKTTVKLGHSLEQFLIDNHDFKDDKRPYMDVIAPDGATVDCKVTFDEKNVDRMVMKVKSRQDWVPVKTDYVIAYKTDGIKCNYLSTIKINEEE